MANNNLSEYDKAKLLRLSKREKKAENAENAEQDGDSAKQTNINNLSDRVEDEQATKREFKKQVRQAGYEFAKNQAKQVAKQVTKKAVKWLAKSAIMFVVQIIGAIFGFLLGTIEFWGPVVLVLLIIIMAAAYTCDIADQFPILKPLVKWATKIDCDAIRQKAQGGLSGGAGASGEYKDEWEANGCKSSDETDAIGGGSSCGGDCVGFEISGIKNSQCMDASESLVKLLKCINDDVSSYGPLTKSDIIITSISDDHGISQCRDNYSYQCPDDTMNDEKCCYHTQGSCHYGHGKNDGSYAIDIRLFPNDDVGIGKEKKEKLGELVKSIKCNGNFFPEGDHYHVSTANCGAI